jgi:hypothetical protein
MTEEIKLRINTHLSGLERRGSFMRYSTIAVIRENMRINSEIATIAVAALGEIIGMIDTTSEDSRDAALTAIADYVNQVFDKIDKVAAPQSEIRYERTTPDAADCNRRIVYSL